MKVKALATSTLVAALLGVGVVAGGVTGVDGVSAQSAAPTQQAGPSQTANPNQATPADPSAGDMKGFGGRGRGDHEGERGLGLVATAEGASQAITNTTGAITSVKADLAYAQGKMDTADVQRWVNGADALLQSAVNANSSSQYGQAVAYAQAARELASTARSVMAQELGAGTLPSAGQDSGRPEKLAPDYSTLTQAQASRIVAQAYERLVAAGASVQAASNASEAGPYLTDGQTAYRAAYDSYQAGNYADAAVSARLAERLAGVAAGIARASTAPANADTPVTVPAPTF